MKTRVILMPVLVGLALVFSVFGCWSGESGDNLAGPVPNNVAAPGFPQIGTARSVRFKIALPGQDTAQTASLTPSIREADFASVSVTFKLILVNVGNASQSTTTLSKTVPADASGTATASFSAVPALTCLGDVHINGGKIGTYTDFHGAADLIAGIDNTIKISPKGSKSLDDVTATVIEILILSPAVLSKIAVSLAQKVASSVATLDLNSSTVIASAVAIVAPGLQIASATLSGISLSPATVSVIIGRTYNLASVTVTAGYSNYSSAIVASVTWSGANASGTITGTTYAAPAIAGTDVLTCSYTEGGVTKTAVATMTVTGTGNMRTDILIYLADLPNHSAARVLSGQQTGDSLAPSNRFSARTCYTQYVEGIRTLTGKVVSVAGASYGNYASATPSIPELLDVNAILKTHWSRGGLVEIQWGPHNPWTGGLPADMNLASHTLTDAATPGTAANVNLTRQLDDIAVAFADLQASGVVVLWRPYHEFNGSWFWWGGVANGQDYINLWQFTYNYLTTTKGLSNLIWLHAGSRVSGSYMQPLDKYYPGDSYVDVVGFDLYNDTIDQAAIDAYTTLTRHPKPFVLAEYGPNTNTTAKTANSFDYSTLISQIRTNIPKACYFMAWSDYTGVAGNEYWSPLNQNNVSQLLSDSWVVNADGVPTFGRTVVGP
ncbi:MAG: hypothetical protein HQM09_19100 [Candidatus Riflebacteria bacterium]|nr:hypothetical protein [Candidatus Riflebacteria bacterium]